MTVTHGCSMLAPATFSSWAGTPNSGPGRPQRGGRLRYGEASLRSEPTGWPASDVLRQKCWTRTRRLPDLSAPGTLSITMRQGIFGRHRRECSAVKGQVIFLRFSTTNVPLILSEYIGLSYYGLKVLRAISNSYPSLAAILPLNGFPVEIVKMEVFSIMRFRTALSVAAFFVLCFTVEVRSTPLAAQGTLRTNAGAERQTVSGRIAAVGDAEFSVEVRDGERRGKRKFLIDGNTSVDGKLSVGAQATVEYRLEGDTSIAIHVSVLETSGIQVH